MDWPEEAHLPIDVLPVVARQLAASSSLHTLAVLLELSSEVHAQLRHLLYSHLSFTSDASLTLFLTPWDQASVRGQNILQCVKSVHLDDAPGPDTTAKILQLAETLPSHRIFLNAHTISISEYALSQLAETAPSVSYNTSRALTKRQEALFRLAQPRTFVEICPGGNHTTISMSRLMGFATRLRQWTELERIVRRGKPSDSALSLTFKRDQPVVLAFHLYRLPECPFPTGWSDTLVGAYLSTLAHDGRPEVSQPDSEDDAKWSPNRRAAFLRYVGFGLATALERGASSTRAKKSWNLEVTVGPG